MRFFFILFNGCPQQMLDFENWQCRSCLEVILPSDHIKWTVENKGVKNWAYTFILEFCWLEVSFLGLWCQQNFHVELQSVPPFSVSNSWFQVLVKLLQWNHKRVLETYSMPVVAGEETRVKNSRCYCDLNFHLINILIFRQIQCFDWIVFVTTRRQLEVLAKQK